MVFTRRLFLAPIFAALTLALIAVGAPANAQSDGKTVVKSGAELDALVDSALEGLYASEPAAKELEGKSVAVLVFPEVLKGGVIVGGQYGEGAMRQGGKTTGYYSMAGASYGLQFGAQVFGYAMYFLNEKSLQFLQDSSGWEVGSGPTLVGGEEGWSAKMGTSDLEGDVAVVFFNQSGLMAGAGIQGTKITKVER